MFNIYLWLYVFGSVLKLIGGAQQSAGTLHVVFSWLCACVCLYNLLRTQLFVIEGGIEYLQQLATCPLLSIT